MGDNGVCDLGALELLLADANLSLRLSSEAKFVTSGKDEECNLAQTCELIGSLLHGDSTQKPWALKSQDYRLVIELHVAPELNFEKEPIVQKIAAKLKQSKCWKSLGLAVASIEARCSDDKVSVWTISLAYHEQACLPARTRLHRLLPNVPFYDTKPPPGVNTIKLEAVRAKLVVSPSPSLTTRPSSLCETLVPAQLDQVLESDPEMLLQETYDGDYAVDSQLHQHDDMEDPDFFNAWSQCSSQPENKVNDFTVQMRDVCEHPPGDCAYPTPSLSQESAETKQHGIIIGPHVLQDQCVSTDALLSAVETGLRYVISKLPARKSRSTTLVGNEDLKCLSSLAPALWEPDYHRSMSERAVFLPTISQAIANVSAHSSTTISLQEKLRQLVRQHSHGSIATSPADIHEGSHAVQKAVSARLWKAMSATLHDTTTTKRMQIFSNSSPPNDDSENPNGPEGMLDYNSTGSQFTQPYEECEFGDCLEAFSDPDNMDETCDWNEVDDFASELCSLHSCWTEELGDRLPDRWNSQQPSGVDHDSDMVDNGLEPDLTDVEGFIEPGDGRMAGSLRTDGLCWDDSYSDHDSITSGFLDFGSGQGGPEVLPSSLPRDAVGATSPNRRGGPTIGDRVLVDSELRDRGEYESIGAEDDLLDTAD